MPQNAEISIVTSISGRVNDVIVSNPVAPAKRHIAFRAPHSHFAKLLELDTYPVVVATPNDLTAPDAWRDNCYQAILGAITAKSIPYFRASPVASLGGHQFDGGAWVASGASLVFAYNFAVQEPDTSTTPATFIDFITTGSVHSPANFVQPITFRYYFSIVSK